MTPLHYKHSKIAIIIATIISPVAFTSPASSEPVDDIEISTTGVREYGVLASGEEKKLGDRASISTSGEYAYGIFSRSAGIATIGDNATISTTGKNASALYVINSGQITLGNNATITATESNSYGLFANGNGTKVTLGNNANFSVSGGSGAGAIWSTDSAQITLGNDAIISTSRNNAHAASTFSSGVLNIGERATLTVSGLNAHALNASGEGNGTNGGIINLGANSHIIVNNNQSSQWAGSHGVRAYDGGVVNLLGGNTITMTGDNIYQTSNAMYATTGGFINGSAGGRYIIQGDIVAGGGHHSTFEPGKIILNLTDESLWNGSSYTQENDEGIGTISLGMTNSVWNMSNSSTLSDLTLNQGAVINFQHTGSDYQTLTINDNYIGNGGTLVFNTFLHNDTSETDKLIVNGQASGLSYVMVNNVGGSGAETIDGIEIITTQGSTDDAFVKSGRIVAGAYEYDLVKSGNNWYLTSSILPEPVEPTPEPEPKPEEPTPEPTPEEPDNNDNSTNETKIIRPESGAYIANLSAANTMFVSRLHNRLGETQYTDYLTGKTKVTSMWLRQEGGHNRSKTKSTQSKTQTNRYVVQIGGDVAQWSTDGLNRLHLGVMAGYGYAHGNTDAKYTAYRAKNKVDGYAVGLYGTWYANQADKSGLYVDSWVQYAWFDNTVQGDGLAKEKYDSKGWLASLETGYSFKLGQSERISYWLQPKAQLIWMGIHADNHYEANGTRVTGNGDNLATRLGLRAYRQGYSEFDNDTGRMFQPFIEANWLYNSKSFGVTMNGVSDFQAGTRNIGEVKVGLEGHLNTNLNMWGSIAQQVGGDGYSDTQATIGIKYSF